MNAEPAEITAVVAASVAIHAVAPASPEHTGVMGEILRTAGPAMGWQVGGIWMLRNDQRRAGGVVNRRAVFEDYRSRLRARSVWLFHGTPPQHLQSILTTALAPSASGAYGPGIYLTPSAGVASGYAFKGGTRHGYLLSCRVALGDDHVKNSSVSKDKHEASIYLVKESRLTYIRFITLLHR